MALFSAANARRPRIVIGFCEIAGFYINLAEGLRDLGCDVRFVSLTAHRFGYRRDTQPALAALIAKLGSWRNGRSKPLRLALDALSLLIRACLLVSLLRCDVFVFAFGSSIFGRLGNWELPLLSMLGKRTIFYFNGSDSRPPYLDGTRRDDVPELVRQTRAIRRRLDWISKFATDIIDNSFSHYFHTRAFIAVGPIGYPLELPEIIASDSCRNDCCDEIRILHAPSDPAAKGTPLIRDCIKRLRQKGYALRLVEISGRPHAEVLAELARCDIVVDQLYSDTPCAGFATEACWFGRCVVVGSYIPAEATNPDFYPETVFIHPDALEETLERLLSDAALRRSCGERARASVHERWNRAAVAARFLRIINSDVPANWICRPGGAGIYPVGLTAEHAKRRIASMIEKAGVGSLCVSDKPGLEYALQHFAYAT